MLYRLVMKNVLMKHFASTTLKSEKKYFILKTKLKFFG